MLKIDNDALSKILYHRDIRRTCIYVHIVIPILTGPLSIVNQTYTLVFDLKYMVPVFECVEDLNATKFICSRKTSERLIREKRVWMIPVSFTEGQCCIDVYYTYIRADEMFKTACIVEKYNPKMFKTYKRYIKLRGE